MAQKLLIRDLTLRDGQQSAFATRMKQEQIDRVLPFYKDANFYAMEVWGGAVPDSVMRYLNENPWDRLEKIKAVVGDVSKLTALSRGRNLFGYAPYTDEIIEGFSRNAIESGLGIKPVMITGDHVVTASAIAKEIGILQDGDEAVTGTQLDKMSDQELDQRVRNISVYARVSPENKIRIVKAWQRQGEVVSMTGDGVNDAPALKAADIGCAMGITGTDVAKGAADMTLTDDNFATIVDAVREGRGIYANIKKVVGFLLGTNIGEILTVFFAMILWRESPFLSMQLLWINLVTDSLPAIALGMEAVEKDVMEQKPRAKSEGLFAHGYGVRIGLQGCMFAILSLLAYQIGKRLYGAVEGGQTLAFMVLALSQVVQAFNMRSFHSIFRIGVFSNKKLNGAALISVALMALVLFVPPVASAFGLAALSSALYLIGLGLSLAPLVVMEIAKAAEWIKH